MRNPFKKLNSIFDKRRKRQAEPNDPLHEELHDVWPDRTWKAIVDTDTSGYDHIIRILLLDAWHFESLGCKVYSNLKKDQFGWHPYPPLIDPGWRPSLKLCKKLWLPNMVGPVA